MDMQPFTMLLIDFAVLTLGGSTLGWLLVEGHGPFGMLQRLRDIVGVRHITTATDDELEWLAEKYQMYPDAEGLEIDYPLWFGTNNIAQMLTCINCTSMNVNIVLFIAYILLFLSSMEHVLVIALLPFAARAIQMKLNS